MPQKVLFCATVDYHFRAFHLPYLKWFKDQGWEVHVAAAGNMDLPFVDKKYTIPIERSPLKWQNFKAYQVLKAVIDQNNYKIIHCHTPMGGVLARLAARQAKQKGTKVIYTAHGFHFFKGAPALNWFLYYPIEKVLSNYTNCLITINEEDYTLAVRHRFKADRIEHVHGVGVDTDRFRPIDAAGRRNLRIQYGYSFEDFLMIYAAEFNRNKNQQLLIQSLAQIKDQIPSARLLLAGDGPLLHECRALAQRLGVAEKIDFLGYRRDLDQLLPMCDIAVASSLREGLPVNILEAMACGLPVVATENRGHRELVMNNVNGWVVGPEDINVMSEKIVLIAKDQDLRKQFGISGLHIIRNKYMISRVLQEKSNIYGGFMKGKEGVQWAVR